MTPTQLTALAAEISTDPAGQGYAPLVTADSNDAIAALLNAKTLTRHGIVPTSQFAIWAAATGMRAVIEDKALATGDPLRSAALTLRDLLCGSMAGLDLSDAANMAGLQAWVALGALTQDNHDSLVALAATPTSRAEALWGVGTVVTASDVGGVIRADDGTRLIGTDPPAPPSDGGQP